MKIYKINVENFRLLRDFSMDLEDDLSLVIGKTIQNNPFHFHPRLFVGTNTNYYTLQIIYTGKTLFSFIQTIISERYFSLNRFLASLQS